MSFNMKPAYHRFFEAIFTRTLHAGRVEKGKMRKIPKSEIAFVRAVARGSAGL
jgi:hypothetical protein